MTIALSSRWEQFVAQQVEAGHFQSEREVLEASLALMEQRQTKLEELRAIIAASDAEGGEFTAEDVRAAIGHALDELPAEAG